jgi:tRNA nucleotidyltransferase (CCA-adding enzyme)
MVLRSNIKIRICAEDIMSRDIKTADINDRVDDTKKALLCEGVAAMPVSDKGKIIGVITLGALNKAIKHGFNHSRIKGYMSGGILTARERTPLHVLRRMMLEHDAGVLPVMKGKDVIGIIRRGDVLKKIHESFFAGSCAEKRRITLNISKKMAAIFPKDVMALMRLIGRLANKSRYTAFVVGGLVRDLMLGVGNLDLDIVIEGDAIAFGQALSRKLKGALIIHRRFGTCTVVTRKKLKIDLATARKEFYKAPAALPTVEFSSLKDDLMRRDFTINAMAISLNRKSFGQLIDFFGGEYDLHHGRIRVMHELSFIDDPTRIFRAVRFEQRFGFAIDKRTEYLILNAIEEEMFEKVQPQRIRDEAELILKEKEPLKALNRMNQLHELRFIHPKIHLDREAKELCRTADKVLSWYEKARFRKRPIERWLVYLMALLEPLTYDETLKFCDRFVFKRGERLRILSYKKYGRRIARLLSAERKLAPSKIYRILQPLSFEAALLIMAAAGSKRSRLRITDFLSKHNGIRLKIAGEDIKTLGLKPGPDFRTILKKVLYRKIDGRLRTKREELLYARELARQR